jgi:hypothetical protein
VRAMQHCECDLRSRIRAWWMSELLKLETDSNTGDYGEDRIAEDIRLSYDCRGSLISRPGFC